jgi:hypothetical protein
MKPTTRPFQLFMRLSARELRFIKQQAKAAKLLPSQWARDRVLADHPQTPAVNNEPASARPSGTSDGESIAIRGGA